jgi:hypothetical protein
MFFLYERGCFVHPYSGNRNLHDIKAAARMAKSCSRALVLAMVSCHVAIAGTHVIVARSARRNAVATSTAGTTRSVAQVWP